jgi:hypothetical protein
MCALAAVLKENSTRIKSFSNPLPVGRVMRHSPGTALFMDRTSYEDRRVMRALDVIRANILRLKWLAAAARFEIALRNHDRALKAGFRPDQLRVPTGNPGGGQWTHEGGEGSDRSQEARVTLAALKLPRAPNSRPPTTKEQNRIARELTRWGPGALASAIAEGASWLKEFGPVYFASFDSPKTLEELQQAVSDPRPGYDIHHIVEWATAAEGGSEDRLINAPENLVRIPRWKHWQLNSWYEKPNDDYGGMTPRAYARGKSWKIRDLIGLKGLVSIGVLKP